MDSLHEIYDGLFDIDATAIDVPEDYYLSFSNAIEAAGEDHPSIFDPHSLLYLFEYYTITKIGGVNSHYASAEWPGVQIP